MKQFLPTYLYIKTHNITRLKYFGKTSKDPYKYRGSGKHWLAHIKKHGNDVSTEILGYYTTKEECQQVAAEFSIRHNIVESKEWANLILENGLDGGVTNRTNYSTHTELAKKKISDANKGRTPWNKNITRTTRGNTKPRSKETRELLRKANLGKKQTQETIEKRRAKLKGHIVSEETRQKLSKARTGKIVSEKTRQKLRAVIKTDEQKEHLRNINLGKKASDATKEKLSGKVVVIDKQGKMYRIPKEQYYSQVGLKSEWEWVGHKSIEGMARKIKMKR
jgi:NUMOD3 motif